jgi:hypothetical protein
MRWLNSLPAVIGGGYRLLAKMGRKLGKCRKREDRGAEGTEVWGEEGYPLSLGKGPDAAILGEGEGRSRSSRHGVARKIF